MRTQTVHRKAIGLATVDRAGDGTGMGPVALD